MADTSESGPNFKSSRETIEVLMQMSNLLNTGLDTETLMICIKLLDEDVNPEALALLIGELKGGNATNKANQPSK